MRSNNSKYKPKRELKNEISEILLKKIIAACEGYGNGRILADASGITYNTLADVIRTKRATPSCVSKITNGLKELKQAA